VIAYYAAASFTTGGSGFVVLSPDDVEAIRARSRAKDAGPWTTDYDAMAKKTCIRQLFKLLPKSTELARALAHDEAVRTDTEPGAIDVMPAFRADDDPPSSPPPPRPTLSRAQRDREAYAAMHDPRTGELVDPEAAVDPQTGEVFDPPEEPDEELLREIERESAGDDPDDEPRSELFGGEEPTR
jgi:hypothetical protein